MSCQRIKTLGKLGNIKRTLKLHSLVPILPAKTKILLILAKNS